MKRIVAALLALAWACAPARALPPSFTLDSPPPPGAAILYCVDTSSGPPYIARPCDAAHPVQTAGAGGGGGGAVTVADGADITQGAIADLAWVSGTGTLVALDKAIDRDVLLLNAKLPTLGQTTKTGSVSVAIASDQTVPVSGTFFQATQPVSGAAGSFVDGASVTLGAEADAACVTNNGTCTAVALFKRGNQRLTTLNTTLGTPFQAGGSIGNLFALDTTLTTTNTDLGPPGATACATDTGSCSLNALAQRLAQRLTTINTTLGTPLQSGGTVIVTGGVASGSAVGSDAPLKIAAVVSTSAPSYSAGNLQNLLIGSKGGELITPAFGLAQTTGASVTGFYDSAGNTRPIEVGNFLYNGTTADLNLEVVSGTNSTGTGIAAVGVLAQFDDVSPLACTENQFCNLRMSTNRNLYGTIRDAAGNERGANVNASNQLSTSIDNFGGATGGGTLFDLIAAASTNATNIKASAGTVYDVELTNNSATLAYVTFYNTSGTPTCGTSIVGHAMIPANSTSGAGWVSNSVAGKAFSSGIGICVTTGIAGTGAVAPSTYTVDLTYR